ncbi:teneurin-2-like, partial [Aplochiton taeniatus]
MPLEMDLTDRRQRSLSRRSGYRKENQHVTSSLTFAPEDEQEVGDGVATRKCSYSSSETLPAYDHLEGRLPLRYGGCVAELVTRQRQEYVRPAYVELAPVSIRYRLSEMHYTGSFTLAELGVEGPPGHQGSYPSSELSVLQGGNTLRGGSNR